MFVETVTSKNLLFQIVISFKQYLVFLLISLVTMAPTNRLVKVTNLSQGNITNILPNYISKIVSILY